MIRFKCLLLLNIICIITIYGCSNVPKNVSEKSENGSFTIEMRMEKKLKQGPNKVVLFLSDVDDHAVTDAEISIKPWMPSMGHGVMWIPKITEKGNGIYDALIMLNMGGHWELQMEIKKDAVSDKLVMNFPEVEGEKKK